MCPLKRQEEEGARAFGLKHDVTDSVCVAVVFFLAALAAPSLQCIRVSSYSLDAEGLAHFHSPPCVDKRRQTDEKKRNGRRSTLTSTSPPWDVLSLEKKKMICLFLLLTLSTGQR